MEDEDAEKEEMEGDWAGRTVMSYSCVAGFPASSSAKNWIVEVPIVLNVSVCPEAKGMPSNTAEEVAMPLFASAKEKVTVVVAPTVALDGIEEVETMIVGG